MGTSRASEAGSDRVAGREGGGPQAAASAADRELSLLELLQILNRRKGLILTVLLVGVGLTLAVMALLPRVYVARALVMVDPEPSAVGADPTGAAWAPVDTATIDSQVELLGSRTVARQVVGDLGLADDPELNGREPGLWVRLESLLPFLRDLRPAAPAAGAAGDASVALVDRLQSRLTVERVGKSRVIAVTYASRDPARAARLANAVVEHYVVGLLSTKYETTRRAAGWLGQRLAEVRERLAQARQALDAFKAREADTLAAAAGGAGQTAQLDHDLLAATVDREAKEQKLQHLKQLARSGDDQELGASVDDIGASVLLQNLNALKAQTLHRLAELSAQLGERHPKIIDIRREKAELDQRIDAEEQALIAQYASLVEAARSKERALAEEAQRRKAQAVSLGRVQEEVNRLQGDVEIDRRLYEAYQDRLKATVDVEGTQQPDARVISEAVPPASPAFPKPRMVMSVALSVSIAVALLAVYLAELADRGFRGAAEVEVSLGLPCLGLVPRLRHRRGGATPEDYVVERPQSRYAEALRGALATLLSARAPGAGQVVLLTSALPGEGKTTLALSLGRIAAGEGLRVLVIDADLRHPCVHEIFGPRAQAGLAELLRQEVGLGDVLKADPRSTMDVLPGSHRLAQPTRLLGAAGIGRLLSLARERYDLVLVDSAPLLAVADARLLALHADRILFVVRWQCTARTIAGLCRAQLDGSSQKLLGVLLNLVDLRRHARYGHTERAFASARLKAYYAD